jgi:endonuclease/exonuclease/phosphatase family metal-dependent hydrolase
MGGFDVICLQEVFSTLNNRKQKLVKYGAENGFFSFVLPTLPGFLARPMVDSGLLILSRLPIVDSDEHYFSKYFDVDAMSSKGVVFAKIQVENNYLYLFNTHT